MRRALRVDPAPPSPFGDGAFFPGLCVERMPDLLVEWSRSAPMLGVALRGCGGLHAEPPERLRGAALLSGLPEHGT